MEYKLVQKMKFFYLGDHWKTVGEHIFDSFEEMFNFIKSWDRYNQSFTRITVHGTKISFHNSGVCEEFYCHTKKEALQIQNHFRS